MSHYKQETWASATGTMGRLEPGDVNSTGTSAG